LSVISQQLSQRDTISDGFSSGIFYKQTKTVDRL